MACVTCSRKAELSKPDTQSPWVYYNSAGLSGVDGNVSALASCDTLLYAGGSFKHAGKVYARNIAQWDGHAWRALGEGCEKPVVFCAVDAQGRLYALCRQSDLFSSIKRWDGSAWRMIADSVQGTITGMTVDAKGMLLVSGSFRAGSLTVENSAQWNGTSWSQFDASGLVFTNAAGQVFDVRSNLDDNTVQVYRYDDSGWVGIGSGLQLAHPLTNDLKACADGSQRVVVLGKTLDENENREAFLARLEKDGSWKSIPIKDFCSSLDLLTPDVNDTARVWVGVDNCLYEFRSDSLRRFEACHGGNLLLQMKNGRLVTAGSLIFTHGGSQVFIAQFTDNDWASMDSTGADIRAHAGTFIKRKQALFQKIPAQDRPVYCTASNVSDILADAGGGVYVAGNFYFEKNGAYFNHVTYWNNGTYAPLGGGLFGEGGGIKLALAPDGTVYAANASLAGSGHPGLYSWNGSSWNFVRKTPGIISMACDKHGDLYALVTADKSSRPSLCRIPVDSPSVPVELIAKAALFDEIGVELLEIDDSLVHLYGDFLSVGDSLSPGHVGWRIPKSHGRHASGGNKGRARGTGSVPADTDRVRIIQDGPQTVWLVDSLHAWQECRYYLCCTTPRAFNTAYLHMKNVDGLRLESYSNRLASPWYYLTPAEYTISPEAGGHLVKVLIRDSVTARTTVPLKVTIVRTGFIVKTTAGNYSFNGEVWPLVKNHYDIGNDDAESIRVTGSQMFEIQGQTKWCRDTVINKATFPLRLSFGMRSVR